MAPVARVMFREMSAALVVGVTFAAMSACSDSPRRSSNDDDGSGGSGAGDTTDGGSTTSGPPASAFADAALTWATPDGGYDQSGFNGFNQVGGGDYDPGENYWTTMDLTGDGRPDLVVTAVGGVQFGAPGDRSWQLFANTGDGFAKEPSYWLTPDGGYNQSGFNGFNQVAGGDYDPGENYWSTMDLTGDGKPDLVVTAEGGVQFGAPGDRSWKVFVNNGTGFDKEPTYWLTPDGGYNQSGFNGFNQIAGGDYDPGENYWTTTDLTGDGKPDLVVTSEAGVQFGAPGDRSWKVYVNNGAGFDKEPSYWLTPDGGYNQSGFNGFNQIAGGDYDPGENYWTTTDLTGDGKPDLVVTSEAGVQFGAPGDRSWKVYVNNGTGFDKEPTYWLTPDGGYNQSGFNGFNQIAGGDYDPGENYWVTTDLTGDGKPDLVVTAEGGVQFGAPGDRSWKVFVNTGTAFEKEPSYWLTPDGGYNQAGFNGFNQVAGGDYDPGENYWSTMDLTGDGKPDLVVTALGGVQFGGSGGRSWQVYPAIP